MSLYRLLSIAAEAAGAFFTLLICYRIARVLLGHPEWATYALTGWDGAFAMSLVAVQFVSVIFLGRVLESAVEGHDVVKWHKPTAIALATVRIISLALLVAGASIVHRAVVVLEASL